MCAAFALSSLIQLPAWLSVLSTRAEFFFPAFHIFSTRFYSRRTMCTVFTVLYPFLDDEEYKNSHHIWLTLCVLSPLEKRNRFGEISSAVLWNQTEKTHEVTREYSETGDSFFFSWTKRDKHNIPFIFCFHWIEMLRRIGLLLLFHFVFFSSPICYQFDIS